jgi:hypothetical protein
MITADGVSIALMVLVTIGASLFVISYLALSPWWKNEAGKNMMAFMAIVAALLIVGLYYRLTGDIPPDWLRIVTWGTINIPVWWRLSILIRAQLGRYVSTRHTCTQCGQECAR